MPKKIDDLDLDPERIDDRWTEAKLYRAGYTLDFERVCRTCGEEIRVYRHGKTGRLLILDGPTLDVHRCEG